MNLAVSKSLMHVSMYSLSLDVTGGTDGWKLVKHLETICRVCVGEVTRLAPC